MTDLLANLAAIAADIRTSGDTAAAIFAQADAVAAAGVITRELYLARAASYLIETVGTEPAGMATIALIGRELGWL